MDGTGNLYIADTWNHRIRRVDNTGTITTVAGIGGIGINNEGGYSGDDGPAVEAQLNAPSGIAVDGAGNLFIAEVLNNRIRRVDSSGIITTIAGIGESGYSGDGGPAVSAWLYYPAGVVVDNSGNLYIAETGNHRIRRVDANGVITTVAGVGYIREYILGLEDFSGDSGPAVEASLSSPYGVAVDNSGDVFLADTSNHRIRRVDPAGTITTFAGTVGSGFSGDNGPAVAAQLRYPIGVTVDGLGNVHIADTENHRIRILTQASPLNTLQSPRN